MYSNNPEYYYTKLTDLKLEMIAEATKKARLGAEKIAAHTGADLGKLKNLTCFFFKLLRKIRRKNIHGEDLSIQDLKIRTQQQQQ